MTPFLIAVAARGGSQVLRKGASEAVFVHWLQLQFVFLSCRPYRSLVNLNNQYEMPEDRAFVYSSRIPLDDELVVVALPPW